MQEFGCFEKNAELGKGRLIGGKRLYSRSEILAESIGNGRVFRLYTCSQEDGREVPKRHFEQSALDGTSNLMRSDLRVCELLNALWFGT